MVGLMKKVVLEKLISMKRAGADLIITYHAKDAQDGYKKEALNNEKV